jgi:hypothetical protein
MLGIASRQWSDLLSNPVAVAFLIYLLVGFVIAGVIAVRGMKLRRPPSNGMLWERKDHARNSLFLFETVALLSPIVFLIWIALWPLLLLFLWACQEEDDH